MKAMLLTKLSVAAASAISICVLGLAGATAHEPPVAPGPRPAVPRGKIFLFGVKESFTPAGESSVSKVQALRPDGTGLETLLELKHEKGEWVVTGRAAPDGRSLAYSLHRKEDAPREVWVKRADGEPRKVGTGLVTCWSPDGKELACYRPAGKEGEYESYALELASGKERPLPVGKTEIVTDWSGDGRWLAALDSNPEKFFVSKTLGQYPLRQLHLVRADGTARRRLTADADLDNSSPALSPDGGRVAYFQRRPGEKTVEHAFMVRGADGKDPKEIGPYAKFVEGWASYRPHGNPRWSPDGKEVAWLIAPLTKDFGPGKAVQYELAFTQADGSAARRISLSDHKIAFAAGIDWR
jgi:WD40-like Beta Propeller Repeat